MYADRRQVWSQFWPCSLDGAAYRVATFQPAQQLWPRMRPPVLIAPAESCRVVQDAFSILAQGLGAFLAFGGFARVGLMRAVVLRSATIAVPHHLRAFIAFSAALELAVLRLPGASIFSGPRKPQDG